MKPVAVHRHQEVACSNLYWGLLDVPRRSRDEACQYALEEFLPVPLEHVHVTFYRLGASPKVIGCGIDRARVQAALDSGATSLVPADVPEWIGHTISPRDFELLSGEFMPKRLRKARALSMVVFVVTVSLCTALLIFGLERRRTVAARDQQVALASIDRVVSEALPADESAAAQPASLRLTAHLRALRLAVRGGAAGSMDQDVSEQLGVILRGWPRDVPSRVESLSIAAQTATVSVQLPDQSQTERVIQHMSSIAGWELQQPQVTAVKDGVHLRLQLSAERTRK